MLSVCALAVAVAAAAPSSPPEFRTRNVAIVLYEGVELLDFAGPGEVFSAAGGIGRVGDTRAFNVYTVSRSVEPLTSQRFLTVTPEYSIENCPTPDILVIPGGMTELLLPDEPLMRWIDEAADASEVDLTVCTGIFALEELGRLEGLKVTSHHWVVPELRELLGEENVVSNARFVDNGQVITAAGVSAGIDGSLHLVARLCGYTVAKNVATYMEYDWRPKESDVTSYPTEHPGKPADAH